MVIGSSSRSSLSLLGLLPTVTTPRLKCVLCCTDDERLYGFTRIDTGDELSKRVKFVLVTWVGVNVGALKRAKMSIDKAVVKNVITVY